MQCVVFRLDDLQGGWKESAQLAPMNLFILINQSLTLGLIMNPIGNDTKVVDKVHEGQQKGLFELALHGWNHVDYTKLSEQNKTDSVLKANEKMQKLFGYKSNIFIIPFDTFNNDTIKAMSQLQDFAKSIVTVDKNGHYVSLVNLNEITDLSHLIDSILSKNIYITSFSKIVGIESMSRASP